MQRYKIPFFLFMFLNWLVAVPVLAKDDFSSIKKENVVSEKEEVEDDESDEFESGEDELVEDDENPADLTDDPGLRDTPPSRLEVFFRSWTAPIALYFINKWTAFKMYFFVKSQVKKRKKQCRHPNHFHTPCSFNE